MMKLKNLDALTLSVFINKLLLEIRAPLWSVKRHFCTDVLLHISVDIVHIFKHIVFVYNKSLFPCLFYAHLLVVIFPHKFNDLILKLWHSLESSIHVVLYDICVHFLDITSAVHKVTFRFCGTNESGLVHDWKWDIAHVECDHSLVS